MAGTSTSLVQFDARTAAAPIEPGADRVRYEKGGAFQAVLQQRVREQLATHAPGENWGLLGQMLIAGAWFYTSYLLLVFAPLPLWAVAIVGCSLGLSIAGLLMMVVHDAAHNAVSRRHWLNDGIGWLTSCGLAISPDWWKAKHNGLHHPYTNVAGFDDDVDLGSIVRTGPDQPWKPWHRFQHVYAFVLCPLMYLNMIFTADLRYIFKASVGHRRVAVPTLSRTARLLAQKMVGVTFLIGLALWFQPALDVIAVTVVAALVAGASVSLIFQVQHCFEGTAIPSRDVTTGVVDRSWPVAQAEGTTDFGTSNRVLTWFSGGLNHHIEHHLFPRTPHNRLAEIRPIVRATCAEFGVQQTESPTFRAAIRSHARFLRRMGARPVPNLYT